MHPVCAMIALISDQGLVFGTVVGLSLRRLRMEVAAELRVDSELEWRMELTGLPDTAMGWLQLRGAPTVESGLSRYDADILRVVAEDRELFELWVDGVLNHHIVATRPPSTTGPFGAAAAMQGTSPGERAAVVRRMEEQRKNRSRRAMEVLAAGKKRWPSPEDEAGGRRAVAAGWSTELKPAPLERVARPAPRLAARHRDDDPGDPTTRPLPAAPAPQPTRPEAAPHLVFDPPSAPTRPLPPPDVVWEPRTRPTRPEPAAGPSPTLEMDQIAGRCFLTVSWAEGCDWLGSVVPGLETGSLVVDSRGLGAPGTAVRVTLKRPDGAEAHATAEVTRVGEAGSTLRFRAPGLDRRWLLP